jgi:hypothetical protein
VYDEKRAGASGMKKQKSKQILEIAKMEILDINSDQFE